MKSRARTASVLGLVLSAAIFGAVAASAAEPLKIGYSDWPGWVAWQVAIDKGWLKEAGVDVTFNGSIIPPRWTHSLPERSTQI